MKIICNRITEKKMMIYVKGGDTGCYYIVLIDY